jgi:hypothetical protein
MVIINIIRIRRTWNSWPATGFETARARSGEVLVVGNHTEEVMPYKLRG